MPDQSTQPTNRPTVFISYSHKDEVWKDRLIPQLKALEQAGRIAVWNDRKIDGGDKWYPEIKEAMERAAVAVCLITPDYLASDFCIKEEIPYLLDRCEKDGLVFLPLLVRQCPWKAFEWLKERQMLPRDGKTVAHDFKDDWDTPFGEVANYIFEIADDLSSKSFSMPTSEVLRWSPPEKIEIARLPITGSDLFGRQKELVLLDEAWESSATNLISFIAWGGVGKSTLVNKWLERMKADNYRGARRVYAWSFYSQGTSERATSADQFINAALEWFGDENPLAGSPWDKGERLAKLVRQEKTLLLLDGMEPLQSPHNHERGKIKDPALATLVEELARENDGLCLITTRERISDLDEEPQASAFVVPPLGGDVINESDRLKAGLQTRIQQINLELLSPEAGRALLRVGGVRGTDEELERATQDFGCHALALNLLAAYLQDITGHPISAAAQIPDLDVPEAEGKHPRRVIAAFEQKFGEGPEVEVLRLLGLFDRPADGASIAALRKAPKIPKLTDHISEAGEANWLRAIQRLRTCKLIASESHLSSDELDAHPLIREHFRLRLKEERLDVWRESNHRLCEYLKLMAKELPQTVEEMTPLYQAVAHGCEANRHQEVLDNVYKSRILRGREFFNSRTLGAIGADLAMMLNFFDVPWHQPTASLNESSKALVLNQAGYDLRVLGQLKEALQLLLASFDIRKSQIESSATFESFDEWEEFVMNASHLSQLYLTRGDLYEAMKYAQHRMDLADRTGNKQLRVGAFAVIGNIQHQQGKLLEAEVAYHEAEKMQTTQYQFLYSIRGFYYCDLLLSQKKYKEVRDLATQALADAISRSDLLDIGLYHLLIGRAFLFQSQQENIVHSTLASALAHLKQAVDSLRGSGQMDRLPLGLLSQAVFHRVTKEFHRAQSDLDTVRRIAERGEMGLHLCDYHLESARLCLVQDDRDKARRHWATAQEMVERMGYHRRDRDLEEIARELA